MNKKGEKQVGKYFFVDEQAYDQLKQLSKIISTPCSHILKSIVIEQLSLSSYKKYNEKELRSRYMQYIEVNKKGTAISNISAAIKQRYNSIVKVAG